VIISLYLVGVG